MTSNGATRQTPNFYTWDFLVLNHRSRLHSPTQAHTHDAVSSEPSLRPALRSTGSRGFGAGVATARSHCSVSCQSTMSKYHVSSPHFYLLSPRVLTLTPEFGNLVLFPPQRLQTWDAKIKLLVLNQLVNGRSKVRSPHHF